MVDKSLVSHALGHAVADAAYRIAQAQTAYADQRAEEQFRVVVDEVRDCLRGRPAPERAELLARLEAAFPLPHEQISDERPASVAVRDPSDWRGALGELKGLADSLSPTERDTMRAQMLQWLGIDPQPRAVAPTVPSEVLRNVKAALDKLVRCRRVHLGVDFSPKGQPAASTDDFAKLAELAGDVIREVSSLDAAVKKVCEMSKDDFKGLDDVFDPKTIEENEGTSDARQLWKWFADRAAERQPRDRIRMAIKDEMKKTIQLELRRLNPSA
jgi:hypothetical protein